MTSLQADRFKQEHWQDSIVIKFMDVGSAVERQIGDATHAFVQREASLAAEVIRRHTDFAIEAFFTQFPLANAPSSEDVRFFATALRIGRKLERIEKAAIHMARTSLQPPAKPHLKPVFDLELMSRWIQENLAVSLRAFAERDFELASRVVRDSGFLDDVYDQILRRLFTYMAADPPTLRLASKPMAIAQGLQHAGDHVVDIAELTVLMLRSRTLR